MAERLKRVRFYKMDTLDRALLFRWAETIRQPFIMDRWDEKAKSWLDCPLFMEVLGIGGSSDYDLISPFEAALLIASKKISPVDAVSLLTEGL